MRKITSLALGVVFTGSIALLAGPAFADYVQQNTQNDQLDNTVFRAGTDGNTLIGDVTAPTYHVDTINIPYEGEYGWAGCPDVLVGAGNTPINPVYACNDTDSTGGDSAKIIQDVFGMVTEGDSAKVAGNQGFSQYLDLFYASEGDADPSPIGDMGNLLLNDTLDQEIADLDLAGNGIYQRLHDHFSRSFDVANATDADGMDETIISYLAADNTAVLGGQVISYMAQWFQKGDGLQDCLTTGMSNAATVCNHDEFGGHSAVTGTAYDPTGAATQHDP